MKLRPFELTLVVVFGLMMVGALLLLRMYKPPQEESPLKAIGVVTVWGTLPEEGMLNAIGKLAEAQEAYRGVSYRYIKPELLESTFVNALADGNAPDLLLIPHEHIVRLRSRLEAVPYDSFPQRDFRNLYVDGAEIFALSDGVAAYPIGVDPLMMYWNRDLFSQEGFVTPPATWEELVGTTVPALTERTPERVILKSAVAFGEYRNVRNGFGILSLLALQGGSDLVTEGNGMYYMTLDHSSSNLANRRPFATAVTFYSNFSSLSNSLYSWNRTMPLDRDEFLAEKLALYFGFGTEAQELVSRNPNLNFDIAPVPQGQNATVKRNYGVFYGFAVPRAAKNKYGAYLVRTELNSPANVKLIIDAYRLAPVHRSLLAAGSNDVYGRIIYESVPTTRAWLNPDRVRIDEIFTQMMDGIGANRGSISGSVGDAMSRIDQLYRQ